MKKFFTEEEIRLNQQKVRTENMQEEFSLEGKIKSLERNTAGIDYREFAEDYSEKSYRIHFVDLDGNEKSVFIPKSQVKEDGSIPEWLAAEKTGEIGGFDFPFITTKNRKLEKWIGDFSKLEKLIEEKLQAKNIEKREATISKRTKKLSNLTEEIKNLLEEKKSRLI